MRKLACLIFVLSLTIPVFPQKSFHEDFSSYKEGSDASPNWYSTSIGWRIEAGKMLCDVAGRSFLIWEKTPYASVLTLSATLVVREKRTTDWKVAGIAVFLDSNNFWHLALVEAPDSQGRRHYAELCESLEGVWLSQANLRQTDEVGPSDLAWEYNRPYRLTIELDGEGITGYIQGENGQLLWRRRFLFEDKKAVRLGKVGLTNSGFLSIFDDVEVKIMKEERYSPPKPQYPPYKGKGWEGVKAKATGFFYTKKIGEVWWLIDPEGNAFYSVGTDHCNYNVHWAEKLGYAPYNRFVSQKYGSEEAWGKSAVQRLLSWGFTSLGANSSRSVRYQGLAHTEFVALGSSFAQHDYICQPIGWTGFPNVFHPQFEEYCLKRAREVCTPHKDDPWLIGYFIDNELEWFGKSGREWGLADEIFKLPPKHSARRAFVDFLRGRYKTINDFNKAWGVALSSFDELMRVNQAIGETEKAIKDKMDFVALIADRYFSITVKAIKSADPNHLVLGCRFAWTAPDPAWRAAGKYCDVVSVNMYPFVDLEKEEVLDVEKMLWERYKETNKPFMLTEWSFPALDSGLPCTHGAGQRFATQEERAKAFSIFQTLLFRLPFMVGSHYFMWVDEPKEGISTTFPENTNYGLVNGEDEPYPLLVKTASQLNPLVYPIHAREMPNLSLEVQKDRVILKNSGKPDYVEVSFFINGQKEARRLLVKERETLPFSPPSASAYLVYVEARWKGLKIASAKGIFYQKGSSWLDGEWRLPLIIANEGPASVRDIPLSIDLGKHLPSQYRGASLLVADERGNLVPSEYDPDTKELLLLLPEVPPYTALSLFVYPTSQPPSMPFPSQVKVSLNGNKFEIDNGVLRLVKREDDGDLVDEIFIGDLELGRYQALVRQELAQFLWVAPNKIKDVKVRQGTLRTIVDITAGFDGGEAITEVGEKGVFAPLRARPQNYEVAYRLTILSGKPWFLGRFLWLRNTSQNAWKFGAYFHYLPSNIGGSSDDDEPNSTPRRWCYIHEKEEVVPAYYKASPGASWYDPQLKGCFGGLLISREDFHYLFWKDEGGRQHPDIWKDVGKEVKAGEVYQEEGKDLVIYGCKGEDCPGRIEAEVRGWRNAEWKVERIEKRK